MGKFILKIFFCAGVGFGAAVYFNAKNGYDVKTTFEVVAISLFVLLCVVLPILGWRKRRRVRKALKARERQMQAHVSEMIAEWKSLEEYKKANGKFPTVEVPVEFIDADDEAYYYCPNARMFADVNYYIDGCEAVGEQEMTTEDFARTAHMAADELWDDYGDVQLMISKKGIRVAFDNGVVDDLDTFDMKSFVSEYGGFVIRGVANQGMASYAFKVANGPLACGVAQAVVADIKKEQRALERARAKRAAELASGMITSKQLAFVKKLGGKADKSMSKDEASAYIDKLLRAKKK